MSYNNNSNRSRNQERMRSQRKKPPLNGNWQPTVPTWEKKFCYSVGSVPWQKLLETKRYMYLYENVVQWNDSAGEEAFYNAKNRFWAEMNGVPCDISLPDPDIYIDKIDWSSNIDPELYLDLERETKYPAEKDREVEEVVIFGSSLMNQSFSCTGWGEAEEELKPASTCLDPGYRDGNEKGNNQNCWDSNIYQVNGSSKNNEWENYRDESYRWEKWDNSYQAWGQNCEQWNDVNDRTGGDWGTVDSNGRKTEGAGWNMSRYKTSRFHDDDYRMDQGWWSNGRGRKRVNFMY